jgi:hypothetical protein
VEKLGIIRGEGGLANRSDQMADLRASSRARPLPHLTVFTFQNVGVGLLLIQIYRVHIQRPSHLPPAGYLLQSK